MHAKSVIAAVVLALVLSVAALPTLATSGLQIIYIDYANNADEVIVIFNASGSPVDLTGYTIWSQGGQTFVFGVSTLNPQTPVIGAFDVVRVHCAMCDPFKDPRDYRWLTKEGACYKSNVWNDGGDSAKLYAPGSSVPLSEYSYP